MPSQQECSICHEELGPLKKKDRRKHRRLCVGKSVDVWYPMIGANGTSTRVTLHRQRNYNFYCIRCDERTRSPDDIRHHVRSCIYEIQPPSPESPTVSMSSAPYTASFQNISVSSEEYNATMVADPAIISQYGLSSPSPELLILGESPPFQDTKSYTYNLAEYAAELRDTCPPISARSPSATSTNGSAAHSPHSFPLPVPEISVTKSLDADEDSVSPPDANEDTYSDSHYYSDSDHYVEFAPEDAEAVLISDHNNPAIQHVVWRFT
ncbi:hypothetical protein P691DRAFT_810563 [Macrolepiota fuliginosa MF-IS2]|uniref:Uncharacterized protein n=1 Tax=Macrolepiota fuliginosa MF-IS2 TaxID=1400762 RepID=A0A9P5X0Z6_9AGAR|nr:hypothetical protein P691DRAFT_810563 [Macrolepiota fuliginosa MF-IS2]